MKQVEKMQAIGEDRNDGEEANEQQNMFPLSFAAVVKSAKYLEAVAQEEREIERLKKEKIDKKAAEDKKKEDERKAKENERTAKAEERKQEEEAKRAAQLAQLAKSLETATLHKTYVKNLHDQAQAQARETEEYENGIEKMKRWGEDESREGDGRKRIASSPDAQTPRAKKQLSQNGGS